MYRQSFMLDFKKKRKIKGILYSRFMIIVLVVIFIFFIRGVWDVYKKSSFSGYNKTIAEKRLNVLKNKKDSLVSKINKLKTQRGIEAKIRSKFGLVKEGEEVVFVINKDNKNPKINNPNYSIIRGWWSKFVGLF